MPRQNVIQNSFSKGEVSPFARGRTDVNLYANGAERIENFIALPQGGLFRRSGTKYVRSTRLPSQESVLIPFEVSDQQAYMLEFGAGYIHFYKNKEPLFNTTVNNEIDFFTIENNGGFMQIVADDHNSTPFNALPNWTASSVDSNGVLVRLTFTTPHTARTGQIVYVSSAAYPTINGQYTVTRISPYIVDLQSSVYDAAMTDAILYSHGMMAGDRFYVSGATNFAAIANSFQLVKSVQSYFEFTIANQPYSGTAITGIANSAGLFRITSVAHGKANNDNITISDVTNYPTSNGSWNIINVTTDTFDLDGSTFAGAGAVDGTWVPYPTMEEAHTIPIEIVTDFTESELSDIRYAQSADVLYIVHPDHAPQKLIRLDDDGDRDDWLLAECEFTDGPYLSLNDAAPLVDTANPQNGAVYRDVYLDLTSYSHTATATVTAGASFINADDDLYIEYRSGAQWRLARLGTLAGGETSATVSIIDNVLLYLDEATKLTSQRSVTGSAANSPGYSRPRVIGKYGWTGSKNHDAQRIDPGDEIQVDAGVLKSQFSNTFAAADVGKYVRYHAASSAAGTWGLITGLVVNSSGKNVNVTAVTMASNNATGKFIISNESRTVVATARSATSGTTKALFASTDVGRKIRLGFSGKWTWGTITTFTSASQVTITLEEDMPRDVHNAANIAGNRDTATPTSGITYDWRLGAWSDTTGWPEAVAFQEQRLTFGATSTSPQTFWMSISGDFENMAPTELDSTVLDDNAISYTLASAKANKIVSMVSGPALTLITNGGEWQVRASSSINDPITPSNISSKEYTNHGGLASAMPTRIGSSVVFVDRSGRKVQKLFYSYDKDALDSDDLTVISEHILRKHQGALVSTYQQKPHSIFWVGNVDGTLSAMTYNEKQEVVAWHHHEIEGAIVESLACIPSSDGSEDELWMVCKRTINGATKRYVEVLESDFFPGGATENNVNGMKFLESSIYLPSWSGTSISGLNHLEGEEVTVQISTEGGSISTYEDLTVTSGAVTVDGSGEVLIGLPFESIAKSLPPEGGSQFGTSQGRTKRIVELAARVHKMQSITFGPDATSLFTQDMTIGTALTWFTGTYKLVPTNGYNIENGWYITQSNPYPANILFVMSVLETTE
jgi:hypothetical protein